MRGPYDNLFGNSAFDLDHDGQINAGEASFIEETVFGDSGNEYSFDDCDSDDFGDDF